MTDAVTIHEVTEVTEGQGKALFDREAMSELGVSGAEFLAAYEGGALPDSWSPDSVNRLEMLLPFAR